jgi:hypothetical protein
MLIAYRAKTYAKPGPVWYRPRVCGLGLVSNDIFIGSLFLSHMYLVPQMWHAIPTIGEHYIFSLKQMLPSTPFPVSHP